MILILVGSPINSTHLWSMRKVKQVGHDFLQEDRRYAFNTNENRININGLRK